jgi:hypothetical protein
MDFLAVFAAHRCDRMEWLAETIVLHDPNSVAASRGQLRERFEGSDLNSGGGFRRGHIHIMAERKLRRYRATAIQCVGLGSLEDSGKPWLTPFDCLIGEVVTSESEMLGLREEWLCGLRATIEARTRPTDLAQGRVRAVVSWA